MKIISTYRLIIRWLLIITLLFAILAAAQILPGARPVGIEVVTIGMVARSFLFGLVIGLFVGFAQWLVLRYSFVAAQEWIMFTSIGFGVGWSFGLFPSSFAMRFGSEFLGQGGPISVIAYGLAIAVSVAMSQYLLMRRRHRGSKVWLIVTLIGWALAWWFSALPLNFLVEKVGNFADTGAGILFGIIFGSISGLGLIYFKRIETRLGGITTRSI